MFPDEEQEVFEITDFTTASDWERFIARIEEIIHEWKLPLHKPRKPLKKGDLLNGTWMEERESLMFASFQFEAVYHHLSKNLIEEEEVEKLGDEDEGDQLPYCLADMMSKENDFPPRAHCLVRWYGLRDFVIIHPAKANDAIMTEDRTKMLLSSTFIAVNNTNCQVPIFLQLQQMRQKYYLGVCEGGGIRTHFEMIHLHRPFPQYSHLSGLLNLFKNKLSSTLHGSPPITVSVRFMYVLQDWSPYSWPQPPPDIDELGEEFSPGDLIKLPCGAMEDPLLEFHLATVWPSLSADVIIDNDVHSDLNPISAPKWSFRMRTTEDPICSMAEYLKEFYMLAQGYDSVSQLLGNASDDVDNENAQHIAEVLDKLAHPNPVPIPSLSSILSQPQPRRSSLIEPPIINEEILIKILQFIFPDSAPTPGEQDSDEYKDTFGSVTDLGNAISFAKVQEQLHSVKSAPPGSLTWRLALAMCHVNHSYGGLPAVAQLWQDFLLEMRHRWENNYTLPCLEAGPPNMSCCLLHQKLQMLNCCIQRKKAREWLQIRRSRNSIEEVEGVSSERGKGRSSTSSIPGSESDEEEFFECQDNSSSSLDDGARPSRKQVPEGRLRQMGNLTLLNSDDPLFIPITQEPAPVTEDLLEEQAEVLVQLGTHPEGAALRARMQSACLTSDMQAFKAANPKAVLQDFVRWYSPRDLIEKEVVDEATGKKVTQYSLSTRMLLPGNMWLEAWESSHPVPAKRQKRLFDDTKEAEKVLHFLASARTADVVSYLMPMLVHCAVLQLAEEEQIPSILVTKLEETALKAVKVTRSSHPKYEAVLRCLYEAEVIVAQLQSVQAKFSDKENEDKTNSERSSTGSDKLQPKEKVSKEKATLVELSKQRIKEKNEIVRFVLDLLDNSETEVPGAGKGVIGERIRNFFSDAQRASHLILDERSSPGVQNYPSSVQEFPAPSGKEFILRTVMSRPSEHCTPSPQRMYCVLTQEEFRIAGAFSADTTFL